MKQLFLFLTVLFKAVFSQNAFLRECAALHSTITGHYCEALKHQQWRLQPNYGGEYTSYFADSQSAIAKLRIYAAVALVLPIGSRRANDIPYYQMLGKKPLPLSGALAHVLSTYDVSQIAAVQPKESGLPLESRVA